MRRESLGLLLLILALGFRFLGQEARGNRAYRKGDYRAAVESYSEALETARDSARLSYNLGTALLQLGESERARLRLAEGLRAQAPELRARAFYNLGNAQARGSRGAPDKGERLRAAIDAYRRALLLTPDHDDARWNLELALRRLQEQEQDRQALAGSQSPPPARPRGDGDGEEREQREGGPQSQVPRPGERPPQPPAVGEIEDESPLPRDLAEQILRAVEERERGLQREKMRRRRAPARGPDW